MAALEWFRLAVHPAAKYDAYIRLRHICFALLYEADDRSDRHSSVVQQGFRGKNLLIAVETWRHQYASAWLFVRLLMTGMHFVYHILRYLFGATDWLVRPPT